MFRFNYTLYTMYLGLSSWYLTFLSSVPTFVESEVANLFHLSAFCFWKPISNCVQQLMKVGRTGDNTRLQRDREQEGQENGRAGFVCFLFVFFFFHLFSKATHFLCLRRERRYKFTSGTIFDAPFFPTLVIIMWQNGHDTQHDTTRRHCLHNTDHSATSIVFMSMCCSMSGYMQVYRRNTRGEKQCPWWTHPGNDTNETTDTECNP